MREGAVARQPARRQGAGRLAGVLVGAGALAVVAGVPAGASPTKAPATAAATPAASAGARRATADAALRAAVAAARRATSALAPRGAAAAGGIASLPPGQALGKAVAALKAQTRVVLAGTVAQSGTSVKLTVKSAGHGAYVNGTIVVKSPPSGFSGNVQIIIIPSAYYLAGGKSFWAFALSQEGLTKAQQAALVTKLAGAWIELPAAAGKALTSDLGDLTEPARIGTLLLSAGGTLTDGTPKVIGTTEALPIVSSKGVTDWLSMSGPPLPVEITASAVSAIPGIGSISGSAGGTAPGAAPDELTFSYPATLLITAPHGARSITQIVSGG